MKKIDHLFQKKYPYLSQFFAANGHFIWLTIIYYFLGLLCFVFLLPFLSLYLILFLIPIGVLFFAAQNSSKIAGIKIKQDAQKDLLTKLYNSRDCVAVSHKECQTIFNSLYGMKYSENLLVDGTRALAWDLPIIALAVSGLIASYEKPILITILISTCLILFRKSKWEIEINGTTQSKPNDQNIFCLELRRAMELIPSISKNYFVDLLFTHLEKSDSSIDQKKKIFLIERTLLLLGGVYWFLFAQGSISNIMIAFGYFEVLQISLGHLFKFKRIYPLCRDSLESAQTLSRTLQYRADSLGGNEPVLNNPSIHSQSKLAFQAVSFLDETNGIKWMDEYSFVFPVQKIISVAKYPSNSPNHFAKLLTCQKTPNSGKISLEGKSLENYQSRHLKTYVHIVHEEPIVFTGTLRSNLKFFAEAEINDSKIIECLNSLGFPTQQFQLDDEIARVSSRLTEENKQQIHLARALLHTNAKIFYFERPLKYLNKNSAQLFLIALQKFAQNKHLIFWEPCPERDWIEIDYTLFLNDQNNPNFSKHADLLKYNPTYRECLEKASSSLVRELNSKDNLHHTAIQLALNMMNSRNPRFYYIPMSQTCLPGCEICYRLGCKNEAERSIEKIQQVIQKAKSSEFDAAVFSSSFLHHSQIEEIFNFCIQSSIVPMVQIQWKLANQFSNELLKWQKRGMAINLILTGHENPKDIQSSQMKELTESAITHFTISADKTSPLLEFFHYFPTEWLPKTYFHFAPYVKGKNLLSVKEVFNIVDKLIKKYPGLTVRPPLGREVWDARIDKTLSLEADLKPAFALQVNQSTPLISVVIPSFNSGPLLKNTIRHLLAQDLPRSLYEIIVVDDGSTDNNQETIRNFLAPEAEHLNFKYLYFPRVKPRKQGDGNFRAGIARNLGVKHASGELLSFLDADIIVPPNYLNNLIELHKNFDVIQSVRLHLKNKKRNELAEYSKIDPVKQTYVLEKKYWGTFFNLKDWSSVPMFWKYTCTYALSLKTRHFKNAGWFRRTFVYYGFEDTDLGYRLAKMGLKFHLDSTITYHLDTEMDRSEYRQSSFERHLILSKTAKVFYLNNLDPIIFLNLFNMMGHEKSLPDIIKDLGKKSKKLIQSKKNKIKETAYTAPRN